MNNSTMQPYETIPRDGTKIVLCFLIDKEIYIASGYFTVIEEYQRAWIACELLCIDDLPEKVLGWWPMPKFDEVKL